MITELVVPLLASLALAFLAESMTEYVFSVWLDLAKQKWPVLETIQPLRYVAMVVGVGLAFAYRLDLLLAAFPQLPSLAPWVGILLTGMAIGRGSNYLHDFWIEYLGGEE